LRLVKLRELPDPQSFEANPMAAVDPGLTMHVLSPIAEMAGISPAVIGQSLHSAYPFRGFSSKANPLKTLYFNVLYN
jgi:hypothetical protein